MSGYQKIRIEGFEYFIIDAIQDFRAEDSFIHNDNKLARFSGNGESKKHVGTYRGALGERMSNFFNYSKWGFEHSDPNKNNWKTINSARDADAIISENRCFFSKNNLLKYLHDAKTEYYAQEQNYHKDISQFYNQRLEQVQNLSSDHIFFSIYDASDNRSQKQSRGYIRSDDNIWNLWRKLILPSISYLSILKLVKVDQPTSEPLFYFRILLDYQFRSFVHPQEAGEEFEDEPALLGLKKRVYRQGADKYRKDVLNFMPQCPFTLITDERLLIASHIKPYSACIKENNQIEALDYLNGLALSPTYDKLFDQGYITFTDNGELICGTQLSSYTWEKLNINPNAKNKMRIFPEDREKYLDYHRKMVFQDDIEDMI